jgi:hypothetical protein
VCDGGLGRPGPAAASLSGDSDAATWKPAANLNRRPGPRQGDRDRDTLASAGRVSPGPAEWPPGGPHRRQAPPGRAPGGRAVPCHRGMRTAPAAGPRRRAAANAAAARPGGARVRQTRPRACQAGTLTVTAQVDLPVTLPLSTVVLVTSESRAALDCRRPSRLQRAQLGTVRRSADRDSLSPAVRSRCPKWRRQRRSGPGPPARPSECS